MFTPRGNVGQVFHNPVLSQITELVTATRPNGDNKTPSLVVFGEQAIALPAQHVDHERRIAAVFKYQFQRIATLKRSLMSTPRCLTVLYHWP